jgi:hypothetical protein
MVVCAIVLLCSLAVHAAPVGNETKIGEAKNPDASVATALPAQENDVAAAVSAVKESPNPLPTKAASSGKADDARTQSATSTKTQATKSDEAVSEKKKKKSVPDIIKEARKNRGSISGFTELLEWAIVFVLIAPGTFPVMSCVLLACVAFWRRHTRMLFAGHRPHGSSASLNVDIQTVPGSQSAEVVARRRTSTPDDAVYQSQAHTVPLLKGASRASS